MKKYIKEIVTLFIVVTISLNIISYYRSLDLNQSKLDIQTFTLIDGTKYTIDPDKPLLIHFWATWCPVCKIEASNIETISQNFQVITIAVNEKSKEDIQNYLQENDLTFQVVDDYNGNLAREFNISVYPTTFIYKANGELEFSEVGYSSTLGLYLRMLIASF